jgi:hypothetical protein
VTTVRTPRDLAATPASHAEIDLIWGDVARETGYRVERSPDGAGNWSRIGTTAADLTHFEDVSLTPETTYFYRVVAVGEVMESAPTEPVSATTYGVSAPAAPENLVATPARSAVRLRWNDASDVETGFSVWRITSGASWTVIATVPAGSTRYTDAPLRRLTVYQYAITAYNAAGQSSDSNYCVVRTTSGAVASSVPQPSALFSAMLIRSGGTPALHPALAAAAARKSLLQDA